MNQIQIELNLALQICDNIWENNEKKTKLAYNLLLNRLEKYDPEIITALLQNKKLKDRFFIEINGVLIFKQQDFQLFLFQAKVNHSYTNYKNRIGLTNGNYFLKDSMDVVLNFPFKDCILNGGQSSEEGEDIYFKYNNSTAQHSTAQHSTAQHSTAQHSTAQHSTAQHSTAQHNYTLNK